MKTFIPRDPLTNGDLQSLYLATDASSERAPYGLNTDATIEERLNFVRARLEELLPEPIEAEVKAHYPDFVNDFGVFHAKEALDALRRECSSRGVKVTPQLRRIIASIAVAGLRMGMVMSAKLREKGIDPLELLYLHAVSQVQADPTASELRAFDTYCEDFEGFVEGFVEMAAAGTWRGSAVQGGISE